MFGEGEEAHQVLARTFWDEVVQIVQISTNVDYLYKRKRFCFYFFKVYIYLRSCLCKSDSASILLNFTFNLMSDV